MHSLEVLESVCMHSGGRPRAAVNVGPHRSGVMQTPCGAPRLVCELTVTVLKFQTCSSF